MVREEPWVVSVSRDPFAINVVGCSIAFLDVMTTVKRLADYDIVVSICGETGTGKELIARSLHYNSSRSSGPFIPVNCGALPDNLFESELFGYEKGAFTDAKHAHPGLIEQADKGTLFLDEIEALSSKGQVALLRFIQDKQYRRIGGTLLRTADVRIIHASNVPLDELTYRGRFREDLFYRLNVFPIRIPPLRERPDDIPPLANHFLTIFKARFVMPRKYLGSQSIDWMVCRDWPGNVRELENTVQRGVLMASHDEIGPEDLMPRAAPIANSLPEAKSDVSHLMFNEAKRQIIEKFERDYLLSILSRSAGNVTRAAQYAHKERRELGRLLKKHGIRPSDFHTP